jgi:hypothetical protein
MVIPQSDAFDYTAVVPRNGKTRASGWPVQDSPRLRSGQGSATECLVGPSPTIRILDAGLPAGSTKSPASGFLLPRVPRSQIALTATDRSSPATTASFYVDRELTEAMQPGDTMRIVRNHLGALAIAILRGEELVAAAGAVTSAALGNVTARIPRQLVEAALDVFRLHDPDFAFREWPVEVEIGSSRAMLYTGRRDLGDYCVFVEHGMFTGDSAASECLSISRNGLVADAAAIASAQLIDAPHALQITRR